MKIILSFLLLVGIWCQSENMWETVLDHLKSWLWYQEPAGIKFDHWVCLFLWPLCLGESMRQQIPPWFVHLITPCNSQQRSKHNPCPNQIFCVSQRHYWKRDKAKGESHCDEEAPLFIQKDHCKLIGCKINITRVIWGILLHYVHVAGVKLVLLVFDYLTRCIGCTMYAHVYPQSRWGSV